MKMMKRLKLRLIVYSIATLMFTNLHGQETTSIPKFKGAPTFGGYLEWLMNSGSCAPTLYCKRFVGFLQFKIDENGAIPIGSIKISDNIDGCLRSSVRELLLSTHGQWEPIKKNGKPIESGELLQIIYFRLEGACTVDDNYRAKSTMVDDFEQAFKFKGETSCANPVTILPLATVYSPVGSTDLGDSKKKN